MVLPLLLLLVAPPSPNCRLRPSVSKSDSPAWARLSVRSSVRLCCVCLLVSLASALLALWRPGAAVSSHKTLNAVSPLRARSQAGVNGYSRLHWHDKTLVRLKSTNARAISSSSLWALVVQQLHKTTRARRAHTSTPPANTLAS